MSTVVRVVIVNNGCVAVVTQFQYTLIVVINDLSHVVHAALSNNERVSVEYISEPVVFRGNNCSLGIGIFGRCYC